jgi:hypothetical protein
MKEVTLSFGRAVLLEPGLIENNIDTDIYLEPEHIRLLKEANRQLAGGQRYAVLVVSHPYSAFSPESRELSASAEFVQDTIASAVLTQSMSQRLVGNFYLQVHRPHMSTRLFTDRDAAIDWLREEIKRDKEKN